MEAGRVLCQLADAPLDVPNELHAAAIKSLLLFMAGLFFGFLVEKCVA